MSALRGELLISYGPGGHRFYDYEELLVCGVCGWDEGTEGG